jgi:hypothetical protein
MRYSVVLTLDLNNADKQSYRYIDKMLKGVGLGLSRIIENSIGKPVHLPANTYFCETEDGRFESAKEAKEHYVRRVKSLFQREWLKAVFFVVVGENYQFARPSVDFRN